MKVKFGAFLLYLLPFAVFAGAVGAPDDVKLLVKKISFTILNPIISVIFGLAFLFFLWGIVEYIWQSDSDESRAKGTQHILWGLVGMFIMFAAFALVQIIVNTIGADVPIGEFE